MSHAEPKQSQAIAATAARHTARYFQFKVVIVWLSLLAAFLVFVGRFDLDFSVLRDKWRPLLGIELTPDDGLQGVPLTLLVSVGAMAIAIALGSGLGAGQALAQSTRLRPGDLLQLVFFAARRCSSRSF